MNRNDDWLLSGEIQHKISLQNATWYLNVFLCPVALSLEIIFGSWYLIMVCVPTHQLSELSSTEGGLVQLHSAAGCVTNMADLCIERSCNLAKQGTDFPAKSSRSIQNSWQGAFHGRNYWSAAVKPHFCTAEKWRKKKPVLVAHSAVRGWSPPGSWAAELISQASCWCGSGKVDHLWYEFQNRRCWFLGRSSASPTKISQPKNSRCFEISRWRLGDTKIIITKLFWMV